MRILANENFPLDAIELLRQGGMDVQWIREFCPGMRDERVLATAVAESRILVTFDKDFGELAFKSHLPSSCGIVLFRIRKQSPNILARRTALPGNDSGTVGKVGPTT